MAEIKSSAGLERKILSEVVPIHTPFSAYIFVTNICNFRCIYCGHSLGYEKMKEQYDFSAEQMSLEIFCQIIDQMAEFPEKLKVISLTGHGEPLLNKELPEMIAYAKQRKVAEKIEFISNASILTKELSDKLIAAGLDCLRVSLQGLSAEKYLEVCDYKLDFEVFISQLKYFYQHKKNCQLFVKIMDIALEANEEEKFYNIFDEISDRMFIEECRPVYAGVEKTEKISITHDRYGREHAPRLVCPLCFFMLGILPNGDVKPCDAIYKPVILGNIRENSLLEMWQGQTLKDFRLMQLRKERNNNTACKSCCAPDDVAHPEDELDSKSISIMERINNYGG